MRKAEVAAGEPPPHRATNRRALAPAVRSAPAGAIPRIVNSLNQWSSPHAKEPTPGDVSGDIRERSPTRATASYSRRMKWLRYLLDGLITLAVGVGAAYAI